MTLVEIKTMLENSGYPVAFHHFEEAQSPPFLVYLTPNSNNVSADSRVVISINTVNVELYTSKKDQAAEKKLEQIYYDNSIAWEKSQQWLSDEKVYETLYEFDMEE